MKKILGLDLGVTSIGWALVTETNDNKNILGMGSRIIPLNTDDKDEFSSGNKISKNQKRTTKRTQRKGYDRYQMRRKTLTNKLIKFEMFDEKLFQLKPIDLWGLRAKAVSEKIKLKELGRILYHLNQKRGYKSSRSDANLDKKDTEYVAEVKSRHQEIKEKGITIGQKFFNELKQNEYYRIKQQVFPREAYIEEFDAILNQQKKHYPKILTNELISNLRNEVIYYQRKLKSQKGLVSVCEFEGFTTKTKEGKEIFTGPKVAPKSSPLFQICKIWESINTINIKNKTGELLQISLEQKVELFNYLDNNEKLSSAELFKILNLKRNDGWYTNKQIEKGIQGNLTKFQILKHLSTTSNLLKFDLNIIETNKETYLVDRKTGEIIDTKNSKVISVDIEQQPLYKLWHTIYSISDIGECTNALINKFGIEKEVAEKLSNIDFTKQAFGNKSAKAMRKILPYLMEGFVYSDACSFAGYNHSNSFTKDEKLQKQLSEKIKLLEKNSLRQPVVEKILNQMINMVNAITDQYGEINEIRIELARELKQSKEERNDTFYNLNKREKENENIRKRIIEDYELRATRNNVIKWRLFHEINNDESKMNATCIYCGNTFGISDALSGNNVDVEHIIPKSLLFDDSQSNKTLSHRACNESKGNKTAYDFMSGKPEEEFNQYIERINNLFKNKIIGKAKRDKLLMSETKIPKDFIDRQLRQTQYIAKKSKEILEEICYNVWSTSGGVTEYLRRIWGWDDVLMNLQLPKYRELEKSTGLKFTEIKEWETEKGAQKHKQEVIKDWSKRDDHRHHAIDALVIACTQQGFIQRINNLSSKGNRDEMYKEVEKQGTIFKEKLSLLDKYLISQKPFNTKQIEEKADAILISFKAGKKVATIGKRKIKKAGKKHVVQKDIIVPRGALSEEFIYGKIKVIDTDLKTNEVVKHKIKYLFENPDLIFKSYIKDLVKERLSKYDNDTKKAISSLKEEPIYLDEEKTKVLEYGSCFKEQFVKKYDLNTLTAKDVSFIIDKKVRDLIEIRLKQPNIKEKEAFKTPLYFDEAKKQAIKSVRMFTGLSSVEPVKKDKNGNDIGFVKPGNNHHIAFYIDENGKKVEHICTFWHAVERKKYNIPVIIKNPNDIWNKILQNKDDYPQNFLEKLPNDKWIYNESLQQNEMFVLGLSKEATDEAIRNNDKKTLNKYLYLVWSVSEDNYWFRHHLETKNSELKKTEGAKESKRYYLCKSIGAFEKLNPMKIKINYLGEIAK